MARTDEVFAGLAPRSVSGRADHLADPVEHVRVGARGVGVGLDLRGVGDAPNGPFSGRCPATWLAGAPRRAGGPGPGTADT